MRLEENMRIRNNGYDAQLVEFDQWLQQLGDGSLDTTEGDYIRLPQRLCAEIDEQNHQQVQNDAINFTFGDINSQSAQPQWRSWQQI